MCHHEVDDGAKRRAVKTLLQYQVLGFGLYQLMQVLRRTSGSFVGDSKQVKGIIHVSNACYATSATIATLWLGYSLPLPPSHTNIALACNPFHLPSVSPPPFTITEPNSPSRL